MTHSLESITGQIEAGITDAVRLSMKYSNDIRIYQCLDRNYQNDIDYLIEYQDNVQQIVENDLPVHLQISGIYFVTDNPTIFSGALVQQRSPITNIAIGEALLEETVFYIGKPGEFGNFRVGLHHVYHKRIDRRSLSIVWPLFRYPEYGNYAKYLSIELSIPYFNALLSDTALFSNLVLVDDENRILFSGNTFSQTGVYDIFQKESLAGGAVVLEHRLTALPLTLYGYYDSGLISEQFDKSVLGMLLVMLIGFGIAAGFILIIGNNLSKRTRNIVLKAQQISKGDFTDQVVRISEEGLDEIAQIEKGVNQLSVQLKAYIDREYSVKLEQSRLEQETVQAKLMALQSQVNPHFLFNALESIRLHALDRERDETVRMIQHMSGMFRYLVDWDGDMILLREELIFLDRYLTIQKYRFGEEFTFSVRVENAAKSVLVPKLILQPLVENACVHGVEATSNDKHIQIEVYTRDKQLVLRVTDNGGGMPAETLQILRGILSGAPYKGQRVGLYNTYQRLKLYYQDKCSFEIDSVPGEGTVCTVIIPI